MLMDNMAYLQQIAGGNNNVAHKENKKSDSPLSKFFNIWTALAAGAVTIIIIIVVVVSSLLGKVDTKDQDLALQSYWQAYYLLEETYDEYADYIKNSDIRNMATSFKSTLNEIKTQTESILLSEFEIDVSDTEEGEISVKEQEINTELNIELQNGHLSGTFDRVFIREFLMQIAYMRSYQSELSARTKKEDLREFSNRMTDNLDNLYDQFHDFKSLAM